MMCCGIGKEDVRARIDKFDWRKSPEPLSVEDKITIEVNDSTRNELSSLQLELAETYREIALLKGDGDDVNYHMLTRILNTHGDDSSETLLSSELAILCQRLSVQLSLLQQKEREIILIEQTIIEIETNARQEYDICQNHIMTYSKENNGFMIRISQLEVQLLAVWKQVEILMITLEQIVFPPRIEYEFELTIIIENLKKANPAPEIEFESESEDELNEIEIRLREIRTINLTLISKHKKAMLRMEEVRKEIQKAKVIATKFRKENEEMLAENERFRADVEALQNRSSSTVVHVDLSEEEREHIRKLRITNEKLKKLVRERMSVTTRITEETVMNTATGEMSRTRQVSNSRSVESRSLEQ